MDYSKKCELLAPAGGISAGKTAFDNGADAIYLGFSEFSARSNALNFDYNDALEIINYKNKFKEEKKVYATINTLIKNSETKRLIELLSFVEDAKFDGVILQDLGVYHLIKKYFPNLELHASTQMAVHNLQGALALRDMGFARVVLARELSFEEIKYITQNCGIETEVFIHGALCYGYSGLCLFSALEKGQSANRGKCAYPCRYEYKDNYSNENLGHIFSMKDFALDEEVKKLKQANVASLKIEGRKKGALYTGALTKYYRNILDDKFSQAQKEETKKDLKAIFSRKQTKLYFNKEKNFRVIDDKKTGHRGLYLGQIEEIVQKGKKRIVAFQTDRKIEKFDGIQIENQDFGMPYGFSAQEFWEKTRNNIKPALFAKKNSKALITLPKDAPEFKKKDEIYLGSSQILKNKYKVNNQKSKKNHLEYSLDFNVEIKKDKISVNALKKGKFGFDITKEYFEKNQKAKNFQTTINTIKKVFSQLGNTDFNALKINIDNEGCFFLAPSLIKKIRRDFLEIVKDEFIKKQKEFFEKLNDSIEKKENKNKEEFILKIDDKRHFDELKQEVIDKLEEIVVDVENVEFEAIKEIIKKLSLSKIRISLPIILRKKDFAKIKEKVGKFLDFGVKKFEFSNIYCWSLFSKNEIKNLDISTSWSLYNMNNFSQKTYEELNVKKITLCVEDEKQNIDSMIETKNITHQKIVYAKIPLFISETCAFSVKENKCRQNCKNKHQKQLISSGGNVYEIIQRNCRNYVFDKRKYYISQLVKDEALRKVIDLSFCEIDNLNCLIENIMGAKNLENTHYFNYKK